MNKNLQPLNKSINMLVEDANYKVQKLNNLYLACKFEEADKYYELLELGEWDEEREEFVHNCDDCLTRNFELKFDDALQYLRSCDMAWLSSIRYTLRENIERELRRTLKLNVYTTPNAECSHSWTDDVVEDCIGSYNNLMQSLSRC